MRLSMDGLLLSEPTSLLTCYLWLTSWAGSGAVWVQISCVSTDWFRVCFFGEVAWSFLLKAIFDWISVSNDESGITSISTPALIA